MYKSIVCLSFALATVGVSAETMEEKAFELTNYVVKVHVETKDGEHGIGSGVVVSPDQIATNCHVIANARGVAVTKIGETFMPVSLKADWHHDLCILKFEQLPLKAVELGDSASLAYEQPVFTIGYPNNSLKPQLAYGNVKAIYPLDDSVIIRTSAGLRMGSSGGALFDESGHLIGLTTFKSPGRDGFYYSLPVQWIKELLPAPEIVLTTQKEPPFWDRPEQDRPYFMQIVLPLQTEKWADLEQIAERWSTQEPQNAEAWYILGLAQSRQQKIEAAISHLQKAIALNKRDAEAYYELGMIAVAKGDDASVQQNLLMLNDLDKEAADNLATAARK